MRVAYVCTDRGVPVFGTKGSSVHVQEITRAFGRAGHRVAIYAARRGDSPPADLVALPVTHVAGFDSGSEAGIAEANAALIATLVGGPRIDLIYERYALWSYAGMEAARVLGVPGILEVNAPLIDEARRFRGAVGLEHAPAVARRAFGAATAVVAVSAPVARYVRAEASRARVAVIANGVDTTRFNPSTPRRSDRFTVGFVGTMKPWHGLPILAEAFVRLAAVEPRARLLLVGEGPDRAQLARQLETAGVGDRVEWSGAVTPDLVPDLLARMDVGVAPYPADAACYFSPLKVFEYLAAGLPVVASRVGQLADLLVDRRTALLVPPSDVTALTEALARLAREPHLRQRLGEAGRRFVAAEHTWDRALDRILRLPQTDLTPPALEGVAF